MTLLKSEMTVTKFIRNAEEICGNVFDGQELALNRNGKPWADLRSVQGGGLPHDRNYAFFSLADFKLDEGKAVIQQHFENGISVIVRDNKDAPVRGRYKNLVVMTPAQNLS